MTAQSIILILAACLLLCLAALFVSTAYFLWQWKKLDRILDGFQQGKLDSSDCDGDDRMDIEETRESRIASQLRRILSSARARERQAIEEKIRPWN